MNILELTKALHTKINAATTSEEVLLLSKVIEKLNTGSVKVVTNYVDLGTEYSLPGEVIFVENEQRLYVGLAGRWVRINTPPVAAWTFGRNNIGQLGDGTSTNRSSPVSVIGGFNDWVLIQAGYDFTTGLRSNGTIWSWGEGSNSELGNGNNTDISSPVSVVGGFTDWVWLSTRSRHSVALRSNGTAWAWGVGNTFRLGTSSTSNSNSPVSVIGGITNWVQASAGYNMTVGIRSDGSAWTWGSNTYRQLGDPSLSQFDSRSSPVSVVGGFTDWVQISAGRIHVAGVRANGTLWCWGENTYGLLGDDTTLRRSSPVSVVGGFTDWVQTSASNSSGSGHTVALRANGTAWAWGANGSGALGDGTTTNRSSPVSVVGGFTDWVMADASSSGHTLGVRANGTAWAWGANSNGQLGDGTTVAKSSPVSIVGGFTNWVQLSGANSRSAGLRSG